MNKCYTEPGKRGLSCIRYNKKKYWTGHFLCSNFLLKHVIEEKVDGRIEVTERRSRLWTCCSKQQTMDCSVRVCGLAAPNRTLWTVLSASVDLLLQTGHYGLFCQHLWTFCSNKDIMDCTVSVFGLAVPTRTLWTVLSASVDLLFQPGLYGLFQLGHYGLFCQCLWTCCSNQDIMDCSVSVCGLAVPTRMLWTLLHDPSSNSLFSTSQQTNRETNKQTKFSVLVTAVCALALYLFITATVDWTVNCDEIVWHVIKGFLTLLGVCQCGEDPSSVLNCLLTYSAALLHSCSVY